MPNYGSYAKFTGELSSKFHAPGGEKKHRRVEEVIADKLRDDFSAEVAGL